MRAGSWFCALLIVLACAAARADDAAQERARQLAGLFMQSCVPFAGDSAGLRRWAGSVPLPPLPRQGQAAFLRGQKGAVFDATNPSGKFVVISGDGGGCSVAAQSADPATLLAAMSQDMAAAGIGLRLLGEHADPEERRLHWREYGAARGARNWSILAGTTADASGMAMLTAAAR